MFRSSATRRPPAAVNHLALVDDELDEAVALLVGRDADVLNRNNPSKCG
jgi:hypothetical protein